MVKIINKIRSARDLRNWYNLNGVYRDHNGNIGYTWAHKKS